MSALSFDGVSDSSSAAVSASSIPLISGGPRQASPSKIDEPHKVFNSQSRNKAIVQISDVNSDLVVESSSIMQNSTVNANHSLILMHGVSVANDNSNMSNQTIGNISASKVNIGE